MLVAMLAEAALCLPRRTEPDALARVMTATLLRVGLTSTDIRPSETAPPLARWLRAQERQ